ncbi:MAG: LTA synthase family protein [Synergistaceae bacterium]|jgi:phosphoglycerol transferase|nr:LTA synthase family protein [Synergistaceae bacterium]
MVFLFFLAVLELAVTLWINARFGLRSIEEIVLTLALPITGVNPRLVLSLSKRVLSSFLITGIYVCLLLWSSREREAERSVAYLGLLVFSPALFLGVNAYYGRRLGLFSKSRHEYTSLYEERYRRVEAEDVVFDAKNNVILILAESLEETFNDEELFGKKIMPGLFSLREKNLSFYGYKQVSGTSATISAMTAYLFGLPLFLPFDINRYGFFSDLFLPSAGSLLEILEKHGYDVFFFAGYDTNFAGGKNIFNTHLKRPNIRDLPYFKEQSRGVPLELRGWGMPDFKLFEAVKRHFSSMKERPFFAIIKTSDTHAPEGGFFERLISEEWGDYRDSLAESDWIVSDFVRWTQEQDFAANTTVIVLGDHLAMTSKVGGISMPDDREIYNVFINPASTFNIDKINKNTQRRAYAAFDLAPTLLESAGGKLPEGRYGLGTSLFRSHLSTLLETKGERYYNTEAQKKSVLYQSFFFPRV